MPTETPDQPELAGRSPFPAEIDPARLQPPGSRSFPRKGNDVSHDTAADLAPGHHDQFERYAIQQGRDECWRWTGAHDRHGYGTSRASHNGTVTRTGAHRLAYLIVRGSIPASLVLDHLCRNRWCVNPWHLEPVTSGENTRRQRLSGVCRRGHEFTAETTYVNKLGHRRCRICMRAAFKRANAKR